MIHQSIPSFSLNVSPMKSTINSSKFACQSFVSGPLVKVFLHQTFALYGSRGVPMHVQIFVLSDVVSKNIANTLISTDENQQHVVMPLSSHLVILL